MGLLLIGLTSSTDNARSCADRFDGLAWSAHPKQKPGLAFQAMFAVETDDGDFARAAADVGLYLVYRRIIKPAAGPGSPDRAIACFAMVRHRELTHRGADDYWRDVHGPLALEHHDAMCDYEQLSVVATLSGTPLDGIALCAFDSRVSMSERFFNDDEARRAIAADVAKFADPASSLPRVVLTQDR